MQSTVQHKKHRLDRYDGWYVSGLDSMHVMMPYMFGPRTKNEAVMSEVLDLTEVDKYLAKKNEGDPDFKYTWFHFIVAVIAKTLYLRPKMNYFITGRRFYERKYIRISFVVKRQLDETAEELQANFLLDKEGNSPLDQVHDYVKGFVQKVRKEDKTVGISNALNVVKNLPRPLFNLMAWALKRMEYHGWYPKGFAKDDPCYASVFVTNLGSIKLHADYHHLFDWGNNSFFIVINEKKLRPFWNEDGTYELRNTIKLGLTIDERIADGTYFAKTIKLVRKMFANPELLDLPVAIPIELD
ncbi:MAG: hypothetical protein J5533_07330 [Bacteroidales bacterium]|nr:hypothetical protein [Bacteroidales bacterium]